MFRPRVIPVLLLKNGGLVKTKKFNKPNYIGDPINAVKIFNDLKVDELVFLDIEANTQNRSVSPHLVKEIGDEAFMPFAVGGGIRNVDEIGELLSSGAEKVVINTNAFLDTKLIESAASKYGNQSIIVSVDIKQTILGKEKVYIRSGKESSSLSIDKYIKTIENAGAGEILINSINRDGMMQGYDLVLIRKISSQTTIPIIACGGAGKLEDLSLAVKEGGASAVAAGSLFVYHGPRNAVLINYPDPEILLKLFN